VPVAAAKEAPATEITFVAVLKKQFGIPNGFVEADILESSAGKVIGSGTIDCRGNGPKNPPDCVLTVVLAHGALFGNLLPSQGKVTRGGLIAGSGRYANATGTVLGTSVSPSRTDVVLTLHT
jgi:hypothetical protein